MKRKLIVSLLALALAPAMAFAQSQSTATRAQVRAELIELEHAGYHADTDVSYPTQLQEAEARVAKRAAQAPKTGGVGGSAADLSVSGAPARMSAEKASGLLPLYFGS